VTYTLAEVNRLTSTNCEMLFRHKITFL